MKIKHLFIDLFCGAGGTSSGIYKALINGQQIAEVVACVNHDKNAIRSHAANFPNALHLTEDIRTTAIDPILKAIKERIEYWEVLGYKVIVHLWASLECTNHSKAKGGQSRDADSRTLANDLFRYIEEIQPQYIWIENVEEFLIWGPLKVKELQFNKKKGINYPHCPLNVIKNKRKKIIGFGPVMVPIKERMAEFYNEWLKEVKSYGYNYEYRLLNSADYGEHTSRKRYYGQFAMAGMPMVWPDQTHTKNPEQRLFGKVLPKWKAVKECLDFSIEGESIFTRKKPLVEASLERIYAGLVKFVAGGKKAFLKQYNSGSNSNRCMDLNDPCRVITTENRFALVKANFLVQRNSGDPDSKICDVENPSRVLTSTGGNLNMVQAFITKYHGKGQNIIGMEDVASTLTTKDRLSYVNVNYWLDKQYSGSANNQSIEKPSGTIVSNDKHYLMKAEHFINKEYSEGSRNQSIEAPSGTLTTVPKLKLVKCWIMDTQYNNIGRSIEEPSPTITANRKHHYIVNPAYGGNTGSVEEPCFTIVARQDKAPLYFVMVEQTGPVAIAVYEGDSEIMIKIKEFMALYGILDIKMRMLEIFELLKIQGFDEGYKLVGTKTEQKKYIGNSVTPRVVKYLIESMHEGLQEHYLNVAA